MSLGVKICSVHLCLPEGEKEDKHPKGAMLLKTLLLFILHVDVFPGAPSPNVTHSVGDVLK